MTKPAPWCTERPPLHEFALTPYEGVHLQCIREGQHPGAHRINLPGQKFGLTLRLEWVDAFPDEPSWWVSPECRRGPQAQHQCERSECTCECHETSDEG